MCGFVCLNDCFFGGEGGLGGRKGNSEAITKLGMSNVAFNVEPFFFFSVEVF